MVYRLFRAMSTRNSSILLRAFKTYVRPLVEYGTTIFNPHKSGVIAKLETVQNSFTRKLMTRVLGFLYDGIPRSDVRNRNLGLRPLAYRRRMFDLIMFYKILHGHVGLRSNKLFGLRASNTRGGSLKVVIPRAKSNVRHYFFVNRAGSVFQKLSKKQPIPSQLSLFKRMLVRNL
ncbi:hypothetical protein Y032_0436g1433 [Ancylostoma ceylanicum]|uniref:Reverse transcriptase domain-containing protein n=1 Tax=Ancylostoma ceylanicum TaxID=53326 RepID=A0A016X0Z2_9BILA|nr:hypothetical protein Y032_0436g1433 [Ancylostoma ceylanicum]